MKFFLKCFKFKCFKRGIVILLLLSLFFPLVLFNQGMAAPADSPYSKTVEEPEELTKKIVEESKQELPGIMEKIWAEEVLPVWKKIWEYFSNWWIDAAWPKIKSFFKKEIEPRAKEEIEKRKPQVEKEFQKEKEELKKEAPEVGKSLWEKFQELIK